ncbi:MAG: GNAT family N-acetyltransferase [Gammaproteobacteria bacterium]|nr:GNAT family N-acetyltransferase [Gammaproteobacteria bacterium]
MNVRLETERLRLREYASGDFFLISQLLSDPVTMTHWPAPLDEAAARNWLERALEAYADPCCGRLAVHLKTGEYIGDAGIVTATIDGRAENDLGYIIDHRYWRRGYGLEAAKALLEFGHLHGLERIVANMATDNRASVRVAERLGMRLERVFSNTGNRQLETRIYVSERARS